MLKRETLPIAKIYVPVKRRATLKSEVVREIAESILEIGQQTPILVRCDGDRFVLVEGLHRLEACKALGEEMIAGYFVSAQSGHQTAPSPYDAEAEAVRQKTDRLRKLRLEKEAEEKAPAALPVSLNTSGLENSSRWSGRIGARPKPMTLSEWLTAREREGFRD